MADSYVAREKIFRCSENASGEAFKNSKLNNNNNKISKFRSILKILPGWLHISSKLKVFS